jgi:hypothetical protein
MVWSILLNRTRSRFGCKFWKTKAVLSEDGTYYKITGQKMWISNAGFVRFSLFLLELKMIKTSQVSS